MTRILSTISTLTVLVVMFFITGAAAVDQNGPGLLEQTKAVVGQGDDNDNADWVVEKTGQFVPLSAGFVDSHGRPIVLGDIIDRPTILLPIYFYCPNICSKNLANLAIALGNLSARPGADFRVIALSFNAAESPEDAARAKRNYLKIVGDEFPAEEWYFLTGNDEAIDAVTDSIGFRFQRLDDETFIHAAALVIVGADGKIIRYVYGSFLAGDIDMGLADAARGTTSLSVKRLLQFCFNYDPDKNKGTFQLVKIGVLVFFGLLVVIAFVFVKRRRPADTTKE